MILSDRELRAALNRGALGITPTPAPEAWSATADDFRLAKELVVWKKPSGVLFFLQPLGCQSRPNWSLSQLHADEILVVANIKPPVGNCRMRPGVAANFAAGQLAIFLGIGVEQHQVAGFLDQ